MKHITVCPSNENYCQQCRKNSASRTTLSFFMLTCSLLKIRKRCSNQKFLCIFTVKIIASKMILKALGWQKPLHTVNIFITSNLFLADNAYIFFQSLFWTPSVFILGCGELLDAFSPFLSRSLVKLMKHVNRGSALCSSFGLSPELGWAESQK